MIDLIWANIIDRGEKHIQWSSKILLNMTHATYFNLKASKSFWEVITRINSTSLVRQETKSTYLGSSTLTSTTQRISLIGQLQFSVTILRMQWIILQDLQAMTYWFWNPFYFAAIFSKIVACVTAEIMRIYQHWIRIHFKVCLDHYFWLEQHLMMSFRNEDIPLWKQKIWAQKCANWFFLRFLLFL